MHNRAATDDGAGGVAVDIVETGGGVHPERAVPLGNHSTTRSARFAETVSAPRAGSNANDSDLDVSMLEHPSSSSSSDAHGVLRNASTRIKQAWQELRRLALRPSRIDDKSKSAATHAIKGLRFIGRCDSSDWYAVEKRFEVLAENGLLRRSRFGKCIAGTKELAFWEQICDSSFDCRLQTFLDMVDKDADGWITEEEVNEIITLSAPAGKLSTIPHMSEEYARLIMEELDPYNRGYIDVRNMEMLLLQTLPTRTGMAKIHELIEALSQIL